jgi:uncharacterized protein
VARPLPGVLGAAAGRARDAAAAAAQEGAAALSETLYGELRADGDDRCAVRFERLFDFTPEELWKALTDPEQLLGWLAHAESFDPRVGGAVELDFGEGVAVRGEVLQLEPGRVLEYTWTHSGEIESLVRFELTPHEHGTLLVLDHRRLTREVGVQYGAGWHAHLDLLEAALAGGSLGFVPRYVELRPAYEEQAASLGPGWAGSGGNALHDAVASADDALARRIAAERPDLRAQPDAEGLLPALRALYLRGREQAEAIAPPAGALDVFHAAALGRVKRLRALLDEDPGRAWASSADGFTPLHLACFSGGEEAAALLIARGGPLEAVATNSRAQVRPLGTAAFARALGCARLLLEAGADPDGSGPHGFTPLHAAAANGDAGLARLLLAHGADPARPAGDGRTPEAVAREAGHAEVAGLLAAGRV